MVVDFSAIQSEYTVTPRGEFARKEWKNMNEQDKKVPVSQKYLLTVREASAYFSIGTKTMRRLAETHSDSFGIHLGNRYLIIRHKFEEFILDSLSEKEEEWNEDESL